MDPLVLVDEVVKDYWKDDIRNHLSDSPYDCFCEEASGRGPHHLLSIEEVLEKLPLPSRADERSRPVWEFFEFDELLNYEVEPYKDWHLEEDICTAEPVWSAIENLKGKPRNAEWRKIVCDLSFFDAGTVRETNDFEDDFDAAFSSFSIHVARELEYPSKPLVEYTDNPVKKIWERTTVDGVPLFEFLGI